MTPVLFDLGKKLGGINAKQIAQGIQAGGGLFVYLALCLVVAYDAVDRGTLLFANMLAQIYLDLFVP